MASPLSAVPARTSPLSALAPWLFVLLWSTGFIGAKLGLPYAEPFTFLALRFALAATLLGALALALRTPWPTNPTAFAHCAAVGLLLHGCYLGGVFSAIHLGMSAGLSALIVGLQPLLTAILGQRLLHEPVAPRQWFGLLLGLAGVGLVLGAPLLRGGPLAVSLPAFGAVTIALVGGTLGTLYQRQYGRELPLLSGTAVQFVAAGVLMLVAALGLETRQIQWTPSFLVALAWLVLVLSLGAILLLMLLIRRSSAARVASLFYLVPPATALEAYFFFGERLAPLALVGLVVAATGVALVNSRAVTR